MIYFHFFISSTKLTITNSLTEQVIFFYHRYSNSFLKLSNLISKNHQHQLANEQHLLAKLSCLNSFCFIANLISIMYK